MTRVNVKFTTKEIELLRSLVSDQLFRREFIDSRLPGYNDTVGDLTLGKQLVARLRSTSERAARVQPGRGPATDLRRSRGTLARTAQNAV